MPQNPFDGDNTHTPDDVCQTRAELASYDGPVSVLTTSGLRESTPSKVIVAEGDSWFDYLPGYDVLVQLHRGYKYKVYKVAEAGDTLENMAYGTEITNSFSRRPAPLLSTLDCIRRRDPMALLLSGGGNDLAGPELMHLIDHADSGTGSVIRESVVAAVIDVGMRRAYEHIIKEARAVKPGLPILIHGYAYPIPDGRSVFRIGGWRFVGPWLRPSFAMKGHEELVANTDTMRLLIDRLNGMLKSLHDPANHIYHVDVRDLIEPTQQDWANELHLRNEQFGAVATAFHEVLETLPQQA